MASATDTAWPPPLATPLAPQQPTHPSLPLRIGNTGNPAHDQEPERQQGDREQEPGVREKQQG